MKFSIIIPHVNEGYYLDIMLDCFEKYVKYKNYEIIIVDDGSPNIKDLDFITSHPLKEKIKVYFEKNLGCGWAKNFWAQKSSGEILFFLDWHMYFQQDILKIVFEILEKNKKIDLLQPTVWSIGDKNVKGQIYKIWNSSLHNWRSFIENNISDQQIFETPWISWGAMIIKKDIFEKLDWFNKLYRKWWVEDLDISIRAWLNWYKCFYTPHIHINHLFKKSFENTQITNDQVLYNKIIFVLILIKNKYLKKIFFDWLKSYYWNLDEAYKNATENEILEKIKLLQKNFVYDDEWYFKKFENYYADLFEKL